MTELTKAVALSGALDEAMLRELAKWRLPVNVPEGEPYSSPDEAAESIQRALESEEQVELRATDLDVMKQYMTTQSKGKIHIVTRQEVGTFDISFGKTKLGQYIIPWRSDPLIESLTNGESYILDNRKKVYLSDVRELYFGEQRAFIICTPAREHG